MTKIILSPILDIDYDLPPFSKFNPEKLFNTDDIKYKINLNIENILLGIEENENETEKKDELILSKNKYGFNYLECLYKLNNEELWDKYKMHKKEIKSYIRNSLVSSINIRDCNHHNFFLIVIKRKFARNCMLGLGLNYMSMLV